MLICCELWELIRANKNSGFFFDSQQKTLTHQGAVHLELLKTEASAPADSATGVSLAVTINRGSRTTAGWYRMVSSAMDHKHCWQRKTVCGCVLSCIPRQNPCFALALIFWDPWEGKTRTLWDVCENSQTQFSVTSTVSLHKFSIEVNRGLFNGFSWAKIFTLIVCLFRFEDWDSST